jgi:AcrR family transcriptional regulator
MPAGRPRKNPTGGPEEVEDPRTQIVAAASRLFARRGIAATTMAEIAEAAGLGPSSLYYWFRSKQQILEVIVTDVNRLPLEFAERAASQGGSPAVRLWRLVRFDAETLCAFPFDINEIHRLAGEDEETFARYWQERQRLNDAVERLIADGVASGDLLDVDPRLAALTILANDEAVQNWYRPVEGIRLAGRSGEAGGEYGPAEIAAFLADLTVRGLLSDPRSLPQVRAEAIAFDRT